MRDDILIVDSRHPDVLPPPRITLFNNGSLQVRDVNINDTAEYLCEVMTSTLALETQLHAIEVQCKNLFSCHTSETTHFMIHFIHTHTDPPSVISTPNGKQDVKLGSAFEIVCEARGIPHPIISWQHNGVPSSTTTLENNRRRLVEVRDRNMAGKIECVATNGVGKPAIAGIDMVVQCQFRRIQLIQIVLIEIPFFYFQFHPK